jgi:DMSO/TMAO reductase YedYZ molybdopterin-dependent catalytic subunit
MALLVPRTNSRHDPWKVTIMRQHLISQSESRDIVRNALGLMAPTSRRRFLQRGASLGALVMLTGCDIQTGNSIETLLRAVSRFNDEVQARLFDPNKLAPSFAESDITRPFPFNGFYPEAEAPEIEASDYQLDVGGMAERKDAWTLDQLYNLPRKSQITQHICIEGWSAIGKWSGVPFRLFLERIGADLRAPYVGFRCADNYSTSIDMASALHPQTQLTLRFADEPLPRPYGFPVKLRIPTKLGFKNPKHIVAITVTDQNPGGFWERYGYNWFSGL